MGILTAGAFNVWDDRLPATILFLVVIPLVSAVVLIQWVGQMLAVHTTGRYLQNLERAIRDEYPSSPASLFTWERSFSDRMALSGKWWMPDLRWHQNAAITVFAMLAVGSLVLGIYKGFHGHAVIVTTVAALELTGLAATCIALLWELGKAAHRQSEDEETSREPGV